MGDLLGEGDRPRAGDGPWVDRPRRGRTGWARRAALERAAGRAMIRRANSGWSRQRRGAPMANTARPRCACSRWGREQALPAGCDAGTIVGCGRASWTDTPRQPAWDAGTGGAGPPRANSSSTCMTRNGDVIYPHGFHHPRPEAALPALIRCRPISAHLGRKATRVEGPCEPRARGEPRHQGPGSSREGGAGHHRRGDYPP